MGGVCGGEEFDSGVIDIDGKGGRQGGVGANTRVVCHSSVAVGLEVADKAFVGDDAGFLESVHPLSNIDVDIATCVSNGQEGLLNDHLIRYFFEVDPYALEVDH